MTEEAKYTLHEARRILALQECQRHGHDWDIHQQLGLGPTALVCARCGESRKVMPSMSISIPERGPTS